MAIKRRQQSNSQANSEPQDSTGSADPSASKGKGSLIWTMARLIENTFSHKGMFWLGVAIALVSFAANAWFYYGLLTQAAGWIPWQAGLGAIGISFGTTLFEVMPVIWSRSPRNTLEQIFAAGSKPQDLPELNGNVVGDADQLMNDYRNSDRQTRNFFKTARWVVIAGESLVGVLFLGSVGVGARALFKLMTFVASIFGTEWGVSLSLRAAQFELPPQIREQLNALIANSGKKLNLRKV
jgi:hypothetical protein